MLAEKVSDTEFMQSFTMNKRPLLVLLERGYMQRSLESEQPPRYVQFLSQMLLRPFEETGTELLVALCNQIALMSQIEMNREKLIKEHVLLPLIELLRSDDDVLLLSVAKALVNLSSGNPIAKDTIVNEGGVRSMIPHLLNKPQELTRAFCVLLKNCLTAPELRERIINDGAIAPSSNFCTRPRSATPTNRRGRGCGRRGCLEPDGALAPRRWSCGRGVEALVPSSRTASRRVAKVLGLPHGARRQLRQGEGERRRRGRSP